MDRRTIDAGTCRKRHTEWNLDDLEQQSATSFPERSQNMGDGIAAVYQTDVCVMSFIPLEVKDSSYAV